MKQKSINCDINDSLEIDLHKYDAFYIIRNVDIHAGFSTLILYALKAIREAQKLNANPVIDFNKENTPDFYDPEHVFFSYGATIS